MLAARRRDGRVRWAVAALLAACAGVQIAAAERWTPAGLRLTALVAAGIAVAVVLLAGLAVDRPGRGTTRPRRAAGTAATAACAVLVGTVSVLGAFALGLGGPPAEVPPAAELPALPTGLALSGDEDLGCGGSSTYCNRRLHVRGTADQSSDEVARRLHDRLIATGWPLVPGDPGEWQGCRTRGLLLDRHELCLSLESAQDGDTWS
ncbi:hypothetical protein ACFQ1I_07005 [Kitasatospora arboriphila]